MFEREDAFYMAHQAEYREKYLNKWLIIANESLFGVYDTPKDAFLAAQEHFKEEEFILHRPADDDIKLEIGPMGIVRLRHPYDANNSKPNPVITTSDGELMTFAYA